MPFPHPMGPYRLPGCDDDRDAILKLSDIMECDGTGPLHLLQALSGKDDEEKGGNQASPVISRM